MYITLERQLKHGPTPGCPGCHCDDTDSKPRNAECRQRFEKLYPTQPGTPGTPVPGTPVPGTPAQPMDLEAGGGEPSQPSRPGAMEGNPDAGSGWKREVPDAGSPALTGSAGSGNAPARADGSGLRRASGTVSPGSKKQKKPEPRGEKRNLDEGEVIGVLPTLHDKGEWDPLFSYPLDGKVEELGAFDERTGQPLPLDKVKGPAS